MGDGGRRTTARVKGARRGRGRRSRTISIVRMDRWMPRLAIVLCALDALGRARAASMDPCDQANERGVVSGERVVVGVGYWAGGDVARWGDAHPCGDRATLGAIGVNGVGVVGTTTFVVNSGEMTALRGTRADEDGLYAANASATAMTVVAYTATKRSTPRVVRLETSDPASEGKSGIVSALTLLVTFDEGAVKYLRWHDAGCGNCGGTADARCLPVGEGHHACAASKAGCDGTCSGSACDVALNTTDALRCQLTVTMATSGTDANKEVFVAGGQLERLSKYASSGAYASAAASASAAVTGVTGFIGR